MSHTVSGSIRKAPFVKEGQNNNGNYTMFCFELSEFNKGFNGSEDSYTNYDVALFAKTQGAIDFHAKAIAEGSFVVVNCDKLLIDKQQGGNGQEYIKLKMMNANLSNFSNPNAQAPQQQQPQQGFAPQGQPQQGGNQGNFHQPHVGTQPANNFDSFDDDIPFS
tara:strand:+ start:1305 stop:1793 length:489 start_codon:yes stop_codon:yes gene_type:complete